MNKLIFCVALLASFAIHSTQAVPIVGEIFFSSTTVATFTPGGANSTTATGVSFGTAAVDFGTGAYAGIGGTAVSFKDFTFGALGTTGPNVVTPLWTLTIPGPKTFSFDLAAITVNALAGTQRNLEGVGTAKITGFDDTPAHWTMNFSGSTTMVSFSAATVAIPDTGATVALVGIGLLGIVGVARRLRKS